MEDCIECQKLNQSKFVDDWDVCEMCLIEMEKFIKDKRDKMQYRCIQPERSKREDKYEVYRPEVYSGPVAIDCKPSKELDEYHKSSLIQVNLENKSYLMRCSELYGNIERDK